MARQFLLALFVLMSCWADPSVIIDGDDISINFTSGGRYTFNPKQAIYSFSVSAGADSRLTIDEINYDESPPNTEVYRFLETSKYNPISDLNMTFSFPTYWLENVGGHSDNLVIMELRDTTWSEINSKYVGESGIRHFVEIWVESLPKLIALGVEVLPTAADTEELEETEAPTENGKAGEISCAEPGDWGECSNGRRTRTTEILINGICVEHEESGICFTDLNRELWIPRFVVLFVLVTVGCISYFVFKLKGL